MKNGGAAFPILDDPLDGDGLRLREYGMTLRDYFAARAMVALLEDSSRTHHANVERMGVARAAERFDEGLQRVPAAAYALADSMLRAREVPA